MVVGAIAPEQDLAALALDHEGEMSGRVAVSFDGADAAYDVIARFQELEPVRNLFRVGAEDSRELFQFTGVFALGRPVIVFGRGNHVASIGE